ncbi:MAG TPA: hypothetical protein VK762_36815 [Polyangiaceae bacterium]|jgi:hypothetical protein|nr:hypothetical protein [Polyangiaceae bacterium]
MIEVDIPAILDRVGAAFTAKLGNPSNKAVEVTLTLTVATAARPFSVDGGTAAASQKVHVVPFGTANVQIGGWGGGSAGDAVSLKGQAPDGAATGDGTVGT